MSFLFLFGGAGSGKTTRAFQDMIGDAVREPERRFFVLVPEQYGMLMQKELLRLHPDHASENIEVLSFGRLAYRVFTELNVRCPDVMDDTGKAMVIRRSAAEKKKELTIYRDLLDRPGFTERVKSMISELKQYCVTPDSLLAEAEKVGSDRLRYKLKDLGTIYKAFEDFLEGKSITREDVPDIFLDVIPGSRLIRDSVILLDGFTGFTPIQYRLIRAFLTMAKEVRVTVTVGAGEDPYRRADQGALFSMSSEMTRRIASLAAEDHVPHGQDIILGRDGMPRFMSSPELAFLESHFLRYDGAVWEGPCPGVSARILKNPEEEVRAAAHEILYLVKEKGYRYREIAVVTADPEGTNGELKHEFLRQGIPFYLDENLSIAGNPLPELLRSAAACVTENASYGSIVRFLKCGLASDDRELVYRFDRYMLTAGIRGFKKLSARWDYLPRGMEEEELFALNGFRERIVTLLEPLRSTMSAPDCRVRDFTAGLRALIERTGAEEKLSAMRERFAAANEDASAREYERVLPEVLKLFEEMDTLMGDEVLRRDEYQAVLEAGLSEIRVGLIPSFADRVPVGDLKRSRFSGVRALIFLNANDGLLPSSPQRNSLITDREKTILKERLGLDLSPTAREAVCSERFYIYRMFCQPSERLTVSASAADRDGKAIRPSGILNRLMKMFPACAGAEEDASSRALSGRSLSPAEAEEKLAASLRSLRKDGAEGFPAEEEELLRERFAALLSCGKAPAAESLISAAFLKNEDAEIGRGAALRLYGSVLSGTVTRFEEFYNCPYRFFLRYGLELEERKVFEIGYADLGTIAHASLEKLFRKLSLEGRDISELSGEELKALAKNCAEEALLDDESGLYRDSARNAWLTGRLSSRITETVRVLQKKLSRGDLRPAMIERKFGPQNGLSALNLPAGTDGMVRLTGKTDRVDVFDDGKRLLVRVVDYKTGSTKWEPWKLWYGTQLQLLLYLDAVTELLKAERPDREIVPAAILYEPVNEPYIKREDVEKAAGRDGEDAAAAADALKISALKPSGLVNSDPDIILHMDRGRGEGGEILPVKWKKGEPDPGAAAADMERFDALKRYARQQASEAGREILEGNVSAVPVSESGTEEGSACGFCPYRSVCGFDRKTEGYHYRRMRKLKPQEVWSAVDASLAGASGSDDALPAEESAESGKEAQNAVLDR